MVKIRDFVKKLFLGFQKDALNLGIICIFLGLLTLITAVIMIIFKSQSSGELIGVMLGLFSVGLGCIAIDMSAKSDKKYTEILTRLDANVIHLVKSYDKELDTIASPNGNIIIRPQPATLELKTYPPEVKVEKIEKKSKEDAQRRLDEDTKKVGFIRGEIFQLKDGSWGIHWGGKYPL